MPIKDNDKKQIRCSFCGKTQGEVKRLLLGPANVNICDECVDLCMSILEEDQ